MGPVFSIIGALLFFLAVALVLSRRGLHRLLESMPLLEGERTLAEIHDATLVLHTGGTPSQRVHQGCVARVTTSRLLIAQRLGDGTHRLLSIVLAPAAEDAMRVVDGQAIDRTLKSFSVGRVVPGSLAETPSGGLELSMTLLGPVVAPPRPPRWELAAGTAETLGPALREAGLG